MAADVFRAVPLDALTMLDIDSPDPDERGEALRHATRVAGLLVTAGVICVDMLFEDVRTLEDDGNVDGTWVISQLPPRFAPRYSALFAKEFVTAFVDLTARLTRGWREPACVAQELGLRVLLNEAESLAELAGFEMEEGWRPYVEETLFEDVDHELLYEDQNDGFEEDPDFALPGMAPMRFADWFTPFNDERTLPPYCLSLDDGRDDFGSV